MSSRMNLRRLKTSDIVIKKTTIEWIVIWILLVFSFINVTTLVASLVILLLFFKQREIGAIKILNIISLRTIINPGLAVDIGSVQNLKWVIIFLCSSYLIASYRKINKNHRMKLNKILLPILAYGLYSILSSFITSTLPTVAIFKMVSYIIPFFGIIIGVYITSRKIDWLDWMSKMFISLLFFSIPLISNPIGYLRNGYSFQGMSNHPNLFGIILALFFAIILTRLQLKKADNHLFMYIILVITFYLGILTKSRTSMIAMSILLIIYIILLKMNSIKKVLIYNIIGVLSIVYLMIDKQIINEIESFLYKGQENILYSRSMQIDGLLSNFLRNPLFGSGFAVPVTPFKSFAFSSEYVVEPGNLILSVLSYGGIFGLILFVAYLFKIFRVSLKNYRQTIFLFLSPILISMGEMVFFSTNNIGVWCYMFISIYIILTPRELRRRRVSG